MGAILCAPAPTCGDYLEAWVLADLQRIRSRSRDDAAEVDRILGGVSGG